MKEKVVFAMLMGSISTGIVSFTLIGINRGFMPGFGWAWLKSWTIAYIVVIPIILIISPLLQRVVRNLCKPRRKYATHDA